MFSIILSKMFEHILLVFYSMFVAMMVAIPLGVVLAKSKKKLLVSFCLKLIAIIQTIPGLALMAFIVSILVFMRTIVNLPATGALPAILVLSIYSLLPILSSTYSAIKQVNPMMLEVATAMGMKKRQIFFYVELPVSINVILSGVRIAIVWTVGMATLTSLVGSGGLGDLIMQGLRSMQINLILAGTIPCAILAIIFDFILSKLSKFLSPKLNSHV